MSGYKPITSLANGEIIKDLLDLCNDNFQRRYFQPYAGANLECLFCGKYVDRPHSDDCPVNKYRELAEKHKRWICKK